MDRVGIKRRLTELMRQVFDDPSIELHEATTAMDVEEWDSLSHINLVVAVEKEFHVKFSTREVSSLANVGEFIDLIGRKIPA